MSFTACRNVRPVRSRTRSIKGNDRQRKVFCMPINLNAPLAWTKADSDELKMLQSLQGNILKGHGRDYTANIFMVGLRLQR